MPWLSVNTTCGQRDQKLEDRSLELEHGESAKTPVTNIASLVFIP
jgi:hypothetical protein